MQPIPSQPTTPTEAELIERARHDSAAFGVLYRLHYSTIVGYLYRRTGDRHVAEDLAAEAFIAAFRALPRYRSGNAPLRSWLYRISTNAANRWARRRARLRLTPLESASEPSGVMREPGALEEAQAALLRLSPDHQAVLCLHYLEDLPIATVAAVLRCREGTVKSRLDRARAALRAELERRSRA